jgi:hypothetical protein
MGAGRLEIQRPIIHVTSATLMAIAGTTAAFRLMIAWQNLVYVCIYTPFLALPNTS